MRATARGQVSGGGRAPTGPQADGGTFGAAANGVPPVSVNVSEGPFVYLHCTCVRSARTCLCEAIWHVCLLPMWTCGAHAHTQMASYVYLCSASLWCARLCVARCAPANACAQASVRVRLDTQVSRNNCSASRCLRPIFQRDKCCPGDQGLPPLSSNSPSWSWPLSLSTPQRLEGADHT